MFIKGFSLLSFVLVFLFHFSVHANNSVTPETLTPKYQSLEKQSQSLYSKLSAQAKRYIRNPSSRHSIRIKSKQRRLVANYLKILDELKPITPIFKFQNQLIQKYGMSQNDPSFEALKIESARIALELFHKTKDLKKEYRMSSIPLLQNMLYDMGAKPRGECHHWAKDLLNHIKPLPRQFFNVTWAESKAGTAREHNSFAIFPKWGNFENGFLFDPWRTGGKPFWINPTQDKHFKWKKWNDYGIY